MVVVSLDGTVEAVTCSTPVHGQSSKDGGCRVGVDPVKESQRHVPTGDVLRLLVSGMDKGLLQDGFRAWREGQLLAERRVTVDWKVPRVDANRGQRRTVQFVGRR